jgi:hypothetical protein
MVADLELCEAAPNGYAVMKFGRLTGDSADAAGLRLYGMVNVRFSDQRWIQPAGQVRAMRLLRLTDDGYRIVTTAEAGVRFEVDEPFRMSFDPVQLLDL